MAVRIGFIGSGGIAGSHLSTLVDNPDAEVVALCDVSADSIERTRASVNRRATNGGLGRTLDAATYDEPSRMLRDERLDAVYLCLPPFVHGEPEEAVIAAGLPMLVEKPVALDLGTAARLLGQIRDREIMAASGYQYRYTQYLARAQQLLEGKTIGQALVTRFGGTPGTPWYHRQELSGGQIIEMATHQMDMLRALVGEVRTVYAAGATRINNREKPEYDIYDVNSITLIFENGAIGSFAANFVVDYRMHLESWGLHVFCDDLLVSLTDAVRASTS
ncbi:MAG: Gfo/Idh/MocA family oxidoreductase, partial [Chloroflexia bacterium]